MDSSNPLVCICIPNYNNEKTIEEALDSILKQTYKNIIIKVFDNASTDKSMEILREYEKKYPHIQIFQNERNIGGEANFTKCIQNAEGKYTAVFHADDCYMPNIIEEQVDFLEKNIHCSAVSTQAYIADHEMKIIKESRLPKKIKSKPFFVFDSSVDFLKEILRYENIIICPSVMVKSDIYKNQIKIWNGKDYKTAADLDVWLRLSEIGYFGIITKPLMFYRLSKHSYSYNNLRITTSTSDMFLVLNSYINKKSYKERLSKKDLNNYNFLIFKDNIRVSINCIIQNNKSKLPIKIFNSNIFQAAFYSKENLKVYLIGIIVIVLRMVPLTQFIRNIIYKYRFKK